MLSKDGKTAPTDQCIMRRYNLSEVTPQMISYAAVLVCKYLLLLISRSSVISSADLHCMEQTGPSRKALLIISSFMIVFFPYSSREKLTMFGYKIHWNGGISEYTNDFMRLIISNTIV